MFYVLCDTFYLNVPFHECFMYRDVDDVHDMMDDIAEQNEIAEEIGTALSTPVGFNQELDEASHEST